MWTSIVRSSTMASSPMAEQSNTALQWEFVEPKRMRPHISRETAIAGHAAQTSGEILDLGFLKLIDTDCSPQGWLTACEVFSGNVIQTNESAIVQRRFLVARAF